MVSCQRCGSELPDGADFCVACSSLVEPTVITEEPVRITSLSGNVAALLADRQYAEAADACHQALHADPNSVEAYTCLGDVYGAQADYAQAVQAYRQALKYEPDDPDAIRRRLDAAIDEQSAPIQQSPPPVAAPAPSTVTVRSAYQSVEHAAPLPPASASQPTFLRILFSPIGLIVLITLTVVITAISITGIVNSQRSHYHPAKKTVPILINTPVPSVTPAPAGGRVTPPSTPTPTPELHNSNPVNTPAGKAPQPSGPGTAGASR